MLHREDSVIINASLERVFTVSKEIERLSEFISEFKHIKLLKREKDKITVEARIRVFGIKITYISVGIIEENRSIRYEQTKGPLKGLLTEWRFDALGKDTRLSVIHDLNLKLLLIGDIVERLLYNLCLRRLARNLLFSMKKELEE